MNNQNVIGDGAFPNMEKCQNSLAPLNIWAYLIKPWDLQRLDGRTDGLARCRSWKCTCLFPWQHLPPLPRWGQLGFALLYCHSTFTLRISKPSATPRLLFNNFSATQKISLIIALSWNANHSRHFLYLHDPKVLDLKLTIWWHGSVVCDWACRYMFWVAWVASRS